VETESGGGKVRNECREVLFDSPLGQFDLKWDGRSLLNVLSPWLPDVQQVQIGIARLSLLDGER
jgi:hypothetical protein